MFTMIYAVLSTLAFAFCVARMFLQRNEASERAAEQAATKREMWKIKQLRDAEKF